MTIRRLRARIGTGLAQSAFVGVLALGCVRMTDAPAQRPPRPSLAAPVVARGPSEGPPRTDHVILIVIDGARWQEIFHGVDPARSAQSGMSDEEVVAPEDLTPNLHALARRGVGLGGEGAPFLASGPNFVSLPGYAEILQGHPARCFENDCPADGAPTLLDDFRALPGATDRDVVMLSSWERLAVLGGTSPDHATISTGRDAGHNLAAVEADPRGAFFLARGREGGPEPGHGDYRRDEATADLAVHLLHTSRPKLLVLSLGDTDEHAHAGDYASYLSALRAADATLGRLTAEVASWGEEGRHVTFAVTADHGRCDGFDGHGRECPESARTFLVMGGGAVPRRGFIGLTEERHLRDIAPTLRTLANAPPVSATPGVDDGVAIREVTATVDRRLASTPSHAPATP